jgi:hypothetical protein
MLDGFFNVVSALFSCWYVDVGCHVNRVLHFLAIGKVEW